MFPWLRKLGFGKESFIKPKVASNAVATPIDWATLPGGQRKIDNERKLTAKGILVNPWLPLFVEAGQPMRSGKEVVDRMRCLTVVACYGHDRDRSFVEAKAEEWELLDLLTPGEMAFWNAEKPSNHVSLQFAWQIECVAALQWAIGMRALLPAASQPCNPSEVVEVAWRSAQIPLTLRMTDEIADMGDLYYRMHWACRQAALQRKPVSGGIVADVVMERRRALQWIVEPDEQWDELSLDT